MSSAPLLISTNRFYPLLLGAVLIVMLIGCSGDTPVTFKRLDFFGEIDNSRLNFTFQGVQDSFHFQLQYSNELSTGVRLDTVLLGTNGKASWFQLITLEKPTLVKVYIDGQVDELFLMPGEESSVVCQLDNRQPTFSFHNPEMDEINAYYDLKTELVGITGQTDFYGRSIMDHGLSEQEVYAAFDSLLLQLNQLLERTAVERNLPPWFVRYEEKNIQFRDQASRKIIPVVRTFFGVDAPAFSDAERPDISFDFNDNLALVTEYYLPAISGFLIDDRDPIEFRELDNNLKFSAYYTLGQRIKSQRVRDVYFCKLVFDMSRLSFFFADTLVNNFKSAVSQEMQPYLARIEDQFNSLEGQPAPAIHLKNAVGELVSLRDLRGNVVLLDFWFVGCRACREERPFDRKLLERFKEKPFQIMKICMNSKAEHWTKMQQDLSGINLISNQAWDKRLTQSFQIAGYPRYVLVNPAGIIVDAWCERPSDPALAQRLDRYFAGQGSL